MNNELSRSKIATLHFRMTRTLLPCVIHTQEPHKPRFKLIKKLEGDLEYSQPYLLVWADPSLKVTVHGPLLVLHEGYQGADWVQQRYGDSIEGNYEYSFKLVGQKYSENPPIYLKKLDYNKLWVIYE